MPRSDTSLSSGSLAGGHGDRVRASIGNGRQSVKRRRVWEPRRDEAVPKLTDKMKLKNQFQSTRSDETVRKRKGARQDKRIPEIGTTGTQSQRQGEEVGNGTQERRTRTLKRKWTGAEGQKWKRE